MKSLLLLLATLFSLTAHAQDVLKLKTGDSLQVKVLEITDQEIKYKRFDNPDGPLFTIQKATAQSVRYNNGTSDVFQKPAPTVATSQTPDYVNENGFDEGDIVTTEYHDEILQGIVKQANKERLRALVIVTKPNGKTEMVNRPFSDLTLIEKTKNPPPATPQYGALTSRTTPGGTSELFFRGQADAKRYYQGYHGAGTGTFFATFLGGLVIGLIPAAACSSTPPKPESLGIRNQELAKDVNYYTGYTQEAYRIKSKKVWGNFGAGALLAAGVALAVFTGAAH